MSAEQLYRLKDGTQVRVSVGKQHYTRPGDAPRVAIIRVRDGHDMWGAKVEDLIPEKEWLKQRKKP
jgi:hypothetical protein